MIINYKSKQKAFSLSEVLITLTVIGVIAAISIPSLQNKINEKELKTQWRKVYSDMEAATRLLKNDNGGTLRGLFTSTTQMKEVYKTYLSSAKSCDNAIADKCWSSSPRLANGAVSTYFADDESSLVLNNGSTLNMHLRDTDCSVHIESSPARGIICAEIYVDVNGQKNPNQVGKDIFRVWIRENGIVPSGSSEIIDGYPSCEDSGQYGGWHCSAKYLY